MIFRLSGRGIVEFTIEKGDGSSFSPESGGEPRKTATIQVLQISLRVDTLWICIERNIN